MVGVVRQPDGAAGGRTACAPGPARPGAPSLVRRPPSGAPVAPGPGPVPDLGGRGPPPAIAGGHRRPAVRVVPPPVSDGPRARPRLRARCAQGMGRRGILRAGAPPAPRSDRTRPGSRRRPAETRGGPSPAPGGRPVHRRRHREPRLRRAGRGARGERAEGRRPMDPRDRGHPNLPRPRPAAGGPPLGTRPGPSRGVQRGRDGTRRDGLPPEVTLVFPVPGGEVLPGPPRASRPRVDPPAAAPRPASPRDRLDRGPPLPGPMVGAPSSDRRAPGRLVGATRREDRTGRGRRGGRPPGASRGDRAPGRAIAPGGDRAPRLHPLLRRAPRVPRRRRRDRDSAWRRAPSLGQRPGVRPASPSGGDRPGDGTGAAASGSSFPGFRIASGSHRAFQPPRSRVATGPSSSGR